MLWPSSLPLTLPPYSLDRGDPKHRFLKFGVCQNSAVAVVPEGCHRFPRCRASSLSLLLPPPSSFIVIFLPVCAHRFAHGERLSVLGVDGHIGVVHDDREQDAVGEVRAVGAGEVEAGEDGVLRCTRGSAAAGRAVKPRGCSRRCNNNTPAHPPLLPSITPRKTYPYVFHGSID